MTTMNWLIDRSQWVVLTPGIDWLHVKYKTRLRMLGDKCLIEHLTHEEYTTHVLHILLPLVAELTTEENPQTIILSRLVHS